MINITGLRIGDIITRVDKYKGYKYSIVEGLDRLIGMIRHREVYEDGGSNMTTSSYEDMSPYPLSIGLLEANGWQKSLDGENVLFGEFKPITYLLRILTTLSTRYCFQVVQKESAMRYSCTK